MFSILRSTSQRQQISQGYRYIKNAQTAMHNAVPMTIVQRASDLTRKFPSDPFPQSSMADYIVQHLPPVDVLEHHVIVMLMDNHLPHPANVRVVQQHGQCGLTQCPNLFGHILRSLLSRSLWARTVDVEPRVDAGKNLDGKLKRR